MATILIAEDDHAISDLVAYNLERAGHTPLFGPVGDPEYSYRRSGFSRNYTLVPHTTS